MTTQTASAMQQSSPQVIVVSNATDLKNAIKTLSAGDGGEIRVVNTGTSYDLKGYDIGHATAEIVITSEDPADPAVFSSIDINLGRNLTFTGITLDSRDVYESRDLYATDINVNNSANISFVGNTFVSAGDGFYYGEGTATRGESVGTIKGTTGVVFSDNEISGYMQGLTLRDVTDAVVADNHIHHMQGDGLRLMGVQDTVVENNVIEYPYGTSQDVNHTDMIQVMAGPTGTQNTENLTIRSNVLNTGDGAATHGIFIKDEAYGSGNEAFKNITVEDNLIYNGHQHGIALTNVEGAVISNNTLLWDEDATMLQSPGKAAQNMKPVIELFNVTGATVENNIASGVHLSNSTGVTQSNNIALDYANPDSAAYAYDHIPGLADGGALDLRDMQLDAQSMLRDGYGSSLTSQSFSDIADSLETVDSAPVAVIQQTVSTLDASLVTYDASDSFSTLGLLDTDDAEFLWTFSDGSTAQGVTVTHDYVYMGEHDVTLTVTTSYGTDTITRETDMVDTGLLQMSFDSALTDASANEWAVDVRNGSAEGSISSGVLHLDGQNDVYVGLFADGVENLPALSMALSVARDEGGKSGLLVHCHGDLHVTVQSNGAIEVKLWTPTGKITAVSAANVLSDTDWHRLALTYDGDEEGLSLYVDGLEVASAEAAGDWVAEGKYDFVLGNAWGASAQVRIDDLNLSEQYLTEAQIAEDNLAAQTLFGADGFDLAA